MEPDSSAMVEVEGVQIVCRTIGKGPPLLVLNGFAATSADWDPCFIDQLASRHKLILLNNRGIGGSTDDGQSFDIAKLANDAAHVIETLGFERTSVMGWSMGGFIAQALAVEYPDRVHKLILLSTDSGGTGADLASPAVWSRLIDTSGTPHQHRDFGDIIAAGRTQLSPKLVKCQAAAMDEWHRNGVTTRLREIRVPVLIATGTEDVVIPPSNALKLVNAIPRAWLAQFSRSGHAFMAQYPQTVAELINSFLALDDAH